MAEMTSPKDFLSAMLDTVDARDSARAEQDTLTKELKKMRASLESLQAKCDKEKTDSVARRRSDLKAGYDKQLKAARARLSSSQTKRQKELTRLMKEKTAASTESTRQEIEGFKASLRAYGKEHSLPGYLTGSAYYTLFCPGPVGYVVLIALFIMLLFFSAGMTIARVGAGGNAAPYILLLLVVIALFAAYLIVWARTRVRYHDDIAACQAIIHDKKGAEARVRDIEKSIQKAGDDSSYDLSSFDEELKAGQSAVDELTAEMNGALDRFDSETAPMLRSEIDAKYAQEISEASASISDDEAKLSDASSRLTQAERTLTSDFVSYVGAEQMTHDKISAMIQYLETSPGATLTDALTAIKTKK